MNDELLASVAAAAADYARPDPDRIRALRDGGGGFDRLVWRQLAEQGWLSITVPEALGGAGLGFDAVAVIAQRLGYAAFTEPYVAAGVMTPYLVASGADEVRGRVLPGLLGGELVAGVAWQGDAGGIGRDSIGVVARPATGGERLSGSARFVPVADADGFVVAASGADGVSLHWLEACSDGLVVTYERRVDGGRSARLRLDDVCVSAGALVAGGDSGWGLLSLAIEAGVTATCAELVGVMERLLELTLGFMRTRVQFGRPIGSFQALQHGAVDLWVQKELARHALATAVAALDDPSSGWETRASAASSAKARASQAAALLARRCVQLHGAIGFTDEYALGISVQRALALAAWLGNASQHRARYAELEGVPA